MPEGSLPIAIQSVIFYILSCSSCNKVTHRRKAKAQAKKELGEKRQLETEQPGLYRHPPPFETNAFWDEEIMMGPRIVKKGAKKCDKNGSQRALNTAGMGSSIDGSSTVPSSSPTMGGSRLSGDNWNRTRYQREDEALWGVDAHWPGQRIKHAIAKAGETAGRLLEGRLSSKTSPMEEQEEWEEERIFWNPGRNPPVNDLHPPVVSTRPSSKAETAWMLQPPPPAKVMEGKVRVGSLRSRAESGASSRPDTNTQLGRKVTDRLAESKTARNDSPMSSRPVSRPKTSNSIRQAGQRHERSQSFSSTSSSDNETVRRKRKKPAPISISPIERDLREAVEHIPIPHEDFPAAGLGVAESKSRPTLPTIASSSILIQGVKNKPLQELSSPSTLNSRAPSPTKALKEQTGDPLEIKFPGERAFAFGGENTKPVSEP